jgi:hypothetical protein
MVSVSPDVDREGGISGCSREALIHTEAGLRAGKLVSRSPSASGPDSGRGCGRHKIEYPAHRRYGLTASLRQRELAPVAAPAVERQQRQPRCRVPCNSGAPAVISRTRYALLLSCTQASVAELRCQTLAPDDQQKYVPPRARLLLWPGEAEVRATGTDSLRTGTRDGHCQLTELMTGTPPYAPTVTEPGTPTTRGP